MKRFIALTFTLFLFALPAAGIAQEKPLSDPQHPLELRDGERVVLLGNTFIERDGQFGYIETALTSRFPDRQVTFRNLGWSGDTVWADSRGLFDPPAAGYQRMIEQVKSLKPTMIFFFYGGNEAFAGKARLEAFEKQLNKLLDDLKPTGARLVLVTPPPHEQAATPRTSVESINANLQLYSEALAKVAEGRKLPLIDFYTRMKQQQAAEKPPLTSNGIHFTAGGYWLAADLLEFLAYQRAADPVVVLSSDGKVITEKGVKVSGVTRTDQGLKFTAACELLPSPVPTENVGGFARSSSLNIIVRGLKGTYQLKVDGHEVPTKLQTSVDRQGHQTILPHPDLAQAEQLRKTILAKNEFYFYQWRPQNVTYLFLFRKHEQGNNAGEIPQFDPLIEAKEKDIATLRVPKQHTIEIIKTETK